MATVSALATTLFLGGWHAPWPIIQLWEGADSGYWPLLWFFGKMLLFIFMFIWLRGSLPRLRYDQFMAFGWKRLIPISLVWIIAVATIRVVTLEGGVDRDYLLGAAGVLLVLFLVLFFIGDSARGRRGRGPRGHATPRSTPSPAASPSRRCPPGCGPRRRRRR